MHAAVAQPDHHDPRTEAQAEGPGAQDAETAHKTVIAPGRGVGIWAALAEVWRERELLWLLIRRDLTIRYKQTVLGVLWAVIQPLALVLVFALFFGLLGKGATDGHPHVLFYFCAIIPYRLFESTITRASGALVADGGLVRRVYFPRLIAPLRCVATGLVDAGIALVVLMVVGLFYEVTPDIRWLAIVPIVLVVSLLALGIGVAACAINAIYRDVGQALPTVLRIGFFASPVLYSTSLVPEHWAWWYALNPMAGAIEAVRWAVLGSSTLTPYMLACTLGGMVLALLVGLVVFRRLESAAVDAL